MPRGILFLYIGVNHTKSVHFGLAEISLRTHYLFPNRMPFNALRVGGPPCVFLDSNASGQIDMCLTLQKRGKTMASENQQAETNKTPDANTAPDLRLNLTQGRYLAYQYIAFRFLHELRISKMPGNADVQIENALEKSDRVVEVFTGMGKNSDDDNRDFETIKSSFEDTLLEMRTFVELTNELVKS